MVSGFHWAQQHSAPLLLYLPFIHSLSHLSASVLYHLTLNCQSMFIYPLSLYSPRLLRPSLFFLSSHPLLFYLYAHCLILFIALALPLPLPLLLPHSIPLSHPQQVQNNISGVDQIFQAHMDSTDGHKS